MDRKTKSKIKLVLVSLLASSFLNSLGQSLPKNVRNKPAIIAIKKDVVKKAEKGKLDLDKVKKELQSVCKDSCVVKLDTSDYMEELREINLALDSEDPETVRNMILTFKRKYAKNPHALEKVDILLSYLNS